jgi:hypothetical protein
MARKVLTVSESTFRSVPAPQIGSEAASKRKTPHHCRPRELVRSAMNACKFVTKIGGAAAASVAPAVAASPVAGAPVDQDLGRIMSIFGVPLLLGVPFILLFFGPDAAKWAMNAIRSHRGHANVSRR